MVDSDDLASNSPRLCVVARCNLASKIQLLAIVDVLKPL